jgi:hypothetical protein
MKRTWHKKGASKPRPPSTPRPRGTEKQHSARRSLSGAWVQALHSLFKSPKAQVGRLSKGSYLTRTRRSNCLHGRAVGTAGGILPLKCRVANRGEPKRCGPSPLGQARASGISGSERQKTSWELRWARSLEPTFARPGQRQPPKGREGDRLRSDLARRGATPTSTRRHQCTWPARGGEEGESAAALMPSRARIEQSTPWPPGLHFLPRRPRPC